ncbi:MAG: hypothetical protein LIO77_08475 [Rikenellaceae bacterium]|nr:hypothetical protein [Rikenellaceae bacterium]
MANKSIDNLGEVIGLRDELARVLDADKINGYSIQNTKQQNEDYRNLQLLHFLQKQDLEQLEQQLRDETRRRLADPDWERPIVMYGVRKQSHKCIKKQEIGVIIDIIPWQRRARTAETHWYEILHRRPATDLEWDNCKGCTRRYLIWHYFIEKGLSVDRALSIIAEDDRSQYGLSTRKTLFCAFEDYYERSINFIPTVTQQSLF